MSATVVDANNLPVTRLWALIAVLATGVLGTAALGAATNAINGMVSTEYYVTVLNWYGVENVWQAAVTQGIFEGLLFGIAFSILFVAGLAIFTRVTCTYRMCLPYVVGILAGALLCWAIGGATAVGLAFVSPEWYQRTFIDVPRETAPMLRFAWVGGSIWGIEIGGLTSVILGLLVFRARWTRVLRLEAADKQGAGRRAR